MHKDAYVCTMHMRESLSKFPVAAFITSRSGPHKTSPPPLSDTGSTSLLSKNVRTFKHLTPPLPLPKPSKNHAPVHTLALASAHLRGVHQCQDQRAPQGVLQPPLPDVVRHRLRDALGTLQACRHICHRVPAAAALVVDVIVCQAAAAVAAVGVDVRLAVVSQAAAVAPAAKG
eukprot:1155499-Pelagomonas_calceolata.AAC.2